MSLATSSAKLAVTRALVPSTRSLKLCADDITISLELVGKLRRCDVLESWTWHIIVRTLLLVYRTTCGRYTIYAKANTGCSE